MADVGRHWIYAVLMGTNQYCMHTEHRQTIICYSILISR